MPDRKLRVGINLLWLVPDQVGGTEEYATRLLMPFATIDDIELTFFCRPTVQASHPELQDVGRVVVAPFPGTNRIARVAIERTWLRRAAQHLDLVHHLGGTMPRRVGRPGLLTVHDLQPLDAPELFSTYKARWLRRAIPTSVGAADRVMTPSRYVADEITDRFGVDPHKVRVVPAHSGPNGALMAADHAVDRAIMSTYGLARLPYLLYPAITYRHKNHIVLIRALAAMIGSASVGAAAAGGLNIVITGRPDTAQAELDREIEQSGLRDQVHCLGRVPSRDFEAIFRNARVLGFPSRYEGFGLPAIEAMERGVPVIAARATALPEVVGDAGLLIEPDDVGGWAEAMATMAFDETARAEMIASGHRRVEDFKPVRCSGRLADIYREVVAETHADRGVRP